MGKAERSMETRAWSKEIPDVDLNLLNDLNLPEDLGKAANPEQAKPSDGVKPPNRILAFILRRIQLNSLQENNLPMKPWITYAFISMIFAGFTSVIAKMGLSGISSDLGLTIRTCFVFVFVLGFAFFVVPHAQIAELTKSNLFWLGLSGATTSLSWIFYYKALKEGDVSTVALIDKGSILVAVLLAFFILKEQITWKTIVGGALMIAGLLIIAKK